MDILGEGFEYVVTLKWLSRASHPVTTINAKHRTVTNGYELYRIFPILLSVWRCSHRIVGKVFFH
jgi:hypothetical protein